MLMTHQDAAGYRKAEECRAKAAKATDEADRFELLTMASSWETLARQAEKDEKTGWT